MSDPCWLFHVIFVGLWICGSYVSALPPGPIDAEVKVFFFAQSSDNVCLNVFHNDNVESDNAQKVDNTYSRATFVCSERLEFRPRGLPPGEVSTRGRFGIHCSLHQELRIDAYSRYGTRRKAWCVSPSAKQKLVVEPGLTGCADIAAVSKDWLQLGQPIVTITADNLATSSTRPHGLPGAKPNVRRAADLAWYVLGTKPAVVYHHYNAHQEVFRQDIADKTYRVCATNAAGSANLLLTITSS